eukprot:TRINITY_DN16107_c0_g1_i2.p1 TRINITY_DN16107_c0_g1~~TRINITY_DN16107_c0_g1_i2.p1  ORF type:complete len:315 (+),score=63.54 TRINITY_DN16107_c0_g1_i2:88-1032(+)
MASAPKQNVKEQEHKHRRSSPSEISELDQASLATKAAGGIGFKELRGVLELVAKLDARGGDKQLKKLAAEVLHEREELERQLTRRRYFSERRQEAQRSLERLREEERKRNCDAVGYQHSISHLQDELVHISRDIKETSEDLTLFREEDELRARAHDKPENGIGGADRQLSEEQRRRDGGGSSRKELQKSSRAMEDCRTKLADVVLQKETAKALQQTLFEQQRQLEHGRSILSAAVEADRTKLESIRLERRSLWEDRIAREREATNVGPERSGPRRPVNPDTAHSAAASAAVRGVRADSPIHRFSDEPPIQSSMR